MTIGPFDQLRSRLQAGLFDCLPDHIARMGWDHDQVTARQRRKLRALLAYAGQHSPFHAKRLSGIDLAAAQPHDLTQIPIMTKPEMMAHFDEVTTDRRLTLTLAEHALARTTTTPVSILDDFVAVATGGSTGLRGVFLLDVAAWTEWAASLMRPSLAALGGRPPPGFTVAMVAAPSPVHATGLLPHVLAGTELAMVSIPATLPLSDLVERLQATQPHLIVGYPSVLARLAQEHANGHLDISPVVVSATSETLTPQLRATIRAGFGVPVIDSYGSTEGLSGASQPDEPTMVFNSDNCIVELVDEHNHPVPAGSQSAKILLTNLTNRVQPLIRYEITDRFLAQPDARTHGTAPGHLRAQVHGRTDDILRYGETLIHPIVIRSALVTTPAVLDYRVRQTPRGIDLTVLLDNSTDHIDLTTLTALLSSGLTTAGLADPIVNIHSTTSLDRHPETGKLQRFINLPTTAT